VVNDADFCILVDASASVGMVDIAGLDDVHNSPSRWPAIGVRAPLPFEAVAQRGGVVSR
jgi:hypothetical protein